MSTTRMASKTVRVGFAAACLTLADCSGCSTPTAATDAAIDGASVSRAADSTPPGAVDAESPCVSSFVAESDCLHPQVAKACVDGWCRIPRGCFVMGSPECQFGRGQFRENENQTTLTHDFEMRQSEITQAEWAAFGYPNPSAVFEKYGDCLAPECPVGNISWFDALFFANALSRAHTPPLPACYELEGCTGAIGNGMNCDGVRVASSSLYECRGYRLPSEAEWEYAARAGTRTAFYSGDIRTTAFSGTCDLDGNLDLAGWYCHNAKGFTHPSGQKQPNAWGLVDMLGNAYEWVSDVDRSQGYGAVPRTDPGSAIESGSLRLRRGGTASTTASVCSVSKGLPGDRNNRGPTGGFRLARTLSGFATDGGLEGDAGARR